MKNRLMLFAMAVSMMLASCAKEEIAAPEQNEVAVKEGVVFKAAIEDGSSRTTFDTETGKVAWAVGDQVKFDYEIEKVAGEAVFSSVLAETDIVDGTATFKSTLSHVFNMSLEEYAATLEEGAKNSRHVYATYPSSIVTDYSNASDFFVTVPAEQDGTFANASIALAKWEKETPAAPLQFMNLCGLLQVNITDEKARRIVISSSTAIVGKVSVTFTPGVPTVKASDKAELSNEVTVNITEPGTYYVAVLPGEMQDVYVEIYDGAGTLIGDRVAENTIPVARRQVRRLGTIETGFSDRFYVKADGTGDGSSWDNASGYAGLVTKLKGTNSALKVYMAAGLYNTGAVASMGIGNTSADVKIYGGYPADVSGNAISGRDYAANPVVLDADGKDRILVIQRGSWMIDGVTFKNALRKVNDTGSALMIEGDASSSFKVRNCTFESNQNTGTAGGGAVRVSNATVEMTNCKFTGNTASQFGSAIFVGGTGVLNMSECSFSKNDVTTYDGTIYVDANASLNMDHCLFYQNTAKRRAGAVSAKGKVNAVNCDFDGNTAGQDGGAIWMRNGGVLKANLCTFRSNVANGTGDATGGGAIYVSETSKVYLNRCFMANNGDQYNAHHIYANSTSSYIGINNSVIRGPWGVTKTQGSLLQLKGSNVIVNTTIYCQTGDWGAISLGSKTENGCRIINDIVINKSSKEYSFYATSYYMQVYNTIYSKDKATESGYGMTYTDCLAGASCRTGGNFPSASSLWTNDGTQFALDGDRYIYVYPWDGATDAGTVIKPTLAEVKKLISGTANVGQEFLTWLGSDELKVNGVEALAMDIRGVARDTDAMWPGSYQDVAVTGNSENFNVR